MKKGNIFDPMIAIFGAGILFYYIAGLATYDVQDQSKELSKVVLEMKERYDEGNNMVLFLNQISDASFKDAINDLGANGGLSESCKKYKDYAVWFSDKECVPSKADKAFSLYMEKHFKEKIEYLSNQVVYEEIVKEKEPKKYEGTPTVQQSKITDYKTYKDLINKYKLNINVDRNVEVEFVPEDKTTFESKQVTYQRYLYIKNLYKYDIKTYDKILGELKSMEAIACLASFNPITDKKDKLNSCIKDKQGFDWDINKEDEHFLFGIEEKTIYGKVIIRFALDLNNLKNIQNSLFT